MRIFISNDDGHFSAGLAALERAAARISDDVWVIAPEKKRSSMGHSISLHDAFTVRELGERRYACSGTPADCAIAAMAWLFADSAKPDLVLSGINEGRNIGEDIAYSGTLSIAREASFWGIPAIAFSAPNDAVFDTPAMDQWLVQVLRGFAHDLSAWHHPNQWLSINLPAQVPAPLCHAIPGRAKIAAQINAEAGDDGTTVLRYVKGRSSRPAPGDEASRIAAGFATVYRLRWNGYAALEDAVLDGLNLSLSTPAATPSPGMPLPDTV